VIAVVVSVPMFAFDIVALPIFAAPVIVKLSDDIKLLAVMSFVADKLEAAKLPVTVTAPNVVLPPLDVAVNANHTFALGAPLVGQTYNVLLLILYHNWPLIGFAGGVLAAKFSTMCTKLVSNVCPYPG
jgi:hypothetical protein